MRSTRVLVLIIIAIVSFVSVNKVDALITRRHLRRADQACSYPWCNWAYQVDERIAPNDPSLYLGEIISFERYSPWMSYEPLANKVSELTNGITSDIEKVRVIADWVKHTRAPYELVSVPFPWTIIEVFDANQGLCDESNYLLAAMLRKVGIPAMPVLTWSNWHTVTRFYVDGSWRIADATPHNGGVGPANIYAEDDPTIIPAYQERPLSSFSNFPIPYHLELASWVSLTSNEVIIDQEKMTSIGLGYGKLIFPVSNKPIYFDPYTGKISNTGIEDHKIRVGINIESKEKTCFEDRGSYFAQPLNPIPTGMVIREFLSSGQSFTFSQDIFGHKVLTLPSCGIYRVSYYFSYVDLNSNSTGNNMVLAFVDVLIEKDKRVLIDRYNLQMIDGANPYYYNALIDYLSDMPTFPPRN